MSELALPEGWVKAKINDVSIKISQKKPHDTDEFFYVDIGSINRETKKINNPNFISGTDAPSRARKIIAKGDVIVSLTRPNLNAVALVDEKYDGHIASTGFEVIRPVLVESGYIFEIVRSFDFVNKLSRDVQGALYPAAKSSDVQSYEISVPPLAEQKIIANTLDSYLTTVSQIQARLDAIPKLIEKFRQSVLQDFLLGNNDTLYESHVLGDIVDIISGVAFKKSQYAENGSKLLQISNVGHGSIKWQSKSFISHDLASEFNGYKLSKKDIILALNRPITHNKLKVATISDKDIPSVLYQRVARLRVEGNSKVIDSEYLFILMQSDFFRNIVTNKLKGSDQPYLNFSDLKSFSLEMPKLEYQVQLVEKIKKLFLYANQIEKSVATAKARVDSLTQSILHQAFTGNLTQEWREQNPELISGDNSAEALLAKIKAEKKTAS